MYRPILLLVLALAFGCKKADTDKPASATDATSSGPSLETGRAKPEADSPAPSLVALPALQPKAQFKLQSAFDTFEPAMQLSADGTVLAVHCQGPKEKTLIKVWTIAGEPKELATFEGMKFAFSPSGKFLLTYDIFAGTTVHEVASKKPVAKLSLSFSHIFFRDDNTLVCTKHSSNFPEASKGTIVVWDVARNADAGSFDIPDNRFLTALPVNGGKEIWLFMTNNKFEVECYDVAAKKLLRVIKPENTSGRPFTGSGVSESVAPDGSTFASNTPQLNVYDGASGKIVGGLPAGVGGSLMGHLPGGTRFLGHPIKWEVQDLNERDYVICDWKAKKGLALIRCAAWGAHKSQTVASNDGKTLVVLSETGEGSIYDVSSVR